MGGGVFYKKEKSRLSDRQQGLGYAKPRRPV